MVLLLEAYILLTMKTPEIFLKTPKDFFLHFVKTHKIIFFSNFFIYTFTYDMKKGRDLISGVAVALYYTQGE